MKAFVPVKGIAEARALLLLKIFSLQFCKLSPQSKFLQMGSFQTKLSIRVEKGPVLTAYPTNILQIAIYST